MLQAQADGEVVEALIEHPMAAVKGHVDADRDHAHQAQENDRYQHGIHHGTGLLSNWPAAAGG